MKKREKKKNNFFIFFILILSILFLYSKYIEPNNLIIKEYKIENEALPDSFDGLKIVHFTDVHYGSTVDLNYLKKIVKLINDQKPDIVFFTGDLLDKRVSLSDKEIDNIKNTLNDISSTLGNYAVNGNHDIENIDEFNKIMDGTFTILNNTENILYYKDNNPISIVGLTDSSETKIDYNALNNEYSNFRFVLEHEPDEFNKIKEYNFNILLSGHSHNGQVRIPIIGTIYTPVGAKKYYDDYYKIDNKEIYISNGIGTSTIDIRFMSTPSINLYRLYAY